MNKITAKTWTHGVLGAALAAGITVGSAGGSVVGTTVPIDFGNDANTRF